MSACAACGNGDATSRCGRCRQAYYCNASCQRSHWPTHKAACAPTSPAPAPACAPAVAAAAPAPAPSRDAAWTGRALTWKDVRRGGGVPVEGVLELTAREAPFFLRHSFDAADSTGEHRRLFFYLDAGTRPPPGLLAVQPGTRLRWRNPHWHQFMDGSAGARIEDGDLSSIQWG